MDFLIFRNKKKHVHDELNLAMGNLINYFNQFQKYYVSVCCFFKITTCP